MEEEKSPDLIALNDELLEKPKEEKEAKRNTKEALIERILNLAEENNLELTFSNTKLKRMSKKELGILLNQMTAEVLQQQMADSVGGKGDVRQGHRYVAHDARYDGDGLRERSEPVPPPLRVPGRWVL